MVCLYCKSSKGFIPFKIRFYEPKMNTNLSHICCRRRIVDAQWLGNGYAVCLNMIYHMGKVFQTLLGFGTNHSREHWKLHWKIVSDCVCYFAPLSLWQVVLEFVDTYQPWKQRHIAFLQKASLFWANWFKWTEGTFDFSNIEGLERKEKP